MERGGVLPRDVGAGDVLLGLASDGVHSNGYSLVRVIVEHSGMQWDDPCPWDAGTLGEVLLTPTRLYVKPALAAAKAGMVHALAHITGGGLTENLPRVLPEGLGARIDLGAWELPGVFRWLTAHGGMDEEELLKTYNSGIGMIVVVPADKADEATAMLRDMGETVFAIGEVTTDEGVTYEGNLV
jgi:phosphoribosylformylglycinamidine cyclo-ligase